MLSRTITSREYGLYIPGWDGKPSNLHISCLPSAKRTPSHALCSTPPALWTPYTMFNLEGYHQEIPSKSFVICFGTKKTTIKKHALSREGETPVPKAFAINHPVEPELALLELPIRDGDCLKRHTGAVCAL